MVLCQVKGSNMGMLGSEHEGKARLTHGPRHYNKCTLWDKCEECEAARAKVSRGMQHLTNEWTYERASAGHTGRGGGMYRACRHGMHGTRAS